MLEHLQEYHGLQFDSEISKIFLKMYELGISFHPIRSFGKSPNFRHPQIPDHFASWWYEHNNLEVNFHEGDWVMCDHNLSFPSYDEHGPLLKGNVDVVEISIIENDIIYLKRCEKTTTEWPSDVKTISLQLEYIQQKFYHVSKPTIHEPDILTNVKKLNFSRKNKKIKITKKIEEKHQDPIVLTKLTPEASICSVVPILNSKKGLNFLSICGEQSDLLGIDIDLSRNHTLEELKLLIDYIDFQITHLSRSMIIVTKSSGLHYYLKHVPGVPTKAPYVKNFKIEIKGVLFTGDVDTRSTRGCLVGPGSLGYNKHTCKPQKYTIFREQTGDRPDVGIDILEFFGQHGNLVMRKQTGLRVRQNNVLSTKKLTPYLNDEFNSYCLQYLNGEYEPIEVTNRGAVVIRHKNTNQKRWCPAYTEGKHEARHGEYGNRCLLWKRENALFYKCLSTKCDTIDVFLGKL